MEQDKEFEVVDKRVTSSDNNPEPEPQSEDLQAEGNGADEASGEAVTAGAEESAASEEQEAEGGQGPAGDVYSIISLSVMMLMESAWQWMGLRVNTYSGKLEKDLTQARIAIDSVVFLADKIAPHVTEADRVAMKAMISDLQINFVQQLNKQ